MGRHNPIMRECGKRMAPRREREREREGWKK